MRYQTIKKKKMKLTVCELFAGVGGFRLGLEKSGWETVWANQYEPSTKVQHAEKCYIKNFGEKNFSNIDINEVEYNKIPNHNLLVGGFPCQDYSVATSAAKGMQGNKGVLWWNIYDIIKTKNPKYILLENVDRLLSSPSSQKGRDFGVILACLRDSDYSVEWRMINAADYGFPQKRRRTFIFGCKNSTVYAKKMLEGGVSPTLWIKEQGFFSKDFPVDIKDKQDDFIFASSLSFTEKIKDVSDNFKFRFSNSGFMTKEQAIYDISVTPKSRRKAKTLRDILEKKVDDKYFIDRSQIGSKNSYDGRRIKRSAMPDKVKKSWYYVKGAKHEIRKTSKGYEFNYDEGAIPFPDNLDSPSRTILTSEGTKNPNRISHIIKDPYNRGRYRVLTPVECERLNGFKKDWTKFDGITDSRRYFFMGNALVVGLIEKMGRRLKEIIEE